jgi:tetratricopeptide (TPR) repeat protein
MIKTLVLLLSLYSFCLAQHSPVESQIVEGRDLIAKKKYSEATSLLTAVVIADPQNYVAYLLRSKAKYGLKDYKGALEDSKSVLLNKSNIDSLALLQANLNVGICYNNLREFQKGIYFLKAARHIDSTDTKIYYSLAYSYLELSQLDSAYNELNNLLKINPQDERGYYGKGKIHLMKKQYEQSITEFDKAIAINSSYTMAYQNRGEAKRSLGDKSGCCQDWSKCLELGYTSIKPFLKAVCK